MAAKGKILLVDNDPEFLEMHKAALLEHEYEVLTAASAREGLDRVRTSMPDLIVIELILEKHDSGFTFCKQIKNDPLFKRIPVVMVSAVAEATGFRFNMEEDGYWMKTDDFLDKPVEPDVLIDKIEALLRATAKAGE